MSHESLFPKSASSLYSFPCRAQREEGSRHLCLGSASREEQHFPSSLPESFSPILKLPEKTQEEDGEPFFQ